VKDSILSEKFHQGVLPERLLGGLPAVLCIMHGAARMVQSTIKMLAYEAILYGGSIENLNKAFGSTVNTNDMVRKESRVNKPSRVCRM